MVYAELKCSEVMLADSYYHVYARGTNKQPIYLDEADYRFFLSLFKRYLSDSNISTRDNSESEYQKLGDAVEILAYCLMPNHFHLLVYQIDKEGMSRLMHSIMTSYSRYFNKKYKRSGPLFGSRYKASLVSSDDYLLHISRYIHCNHSDWINYPHSSIRAYLYDDTQQWLHKNRITELYESSIKYLDFLNDYRADIDEVVI